MYEMISADKNVTIEEMLNFLYENMTNYANLSEEDYLLRQFGPKYLSLKLVIPITIVYVTIFVMGIFGNVVTCWVIFRNPIMQTATNYYLFSLAVSDLMLLVLGLPFELRGFWQQYPWELGLGLCKLRSYVSETSSYVSVLTIVAFSMERYLAICHPLHLYAMSGLKRPLRFIIVAWLVALLAALPFAVYTKINYVEYPPGSGYYSEESAFCAMLLPNMPDFPLYELSCVIFFLIPLVLLIILYLRMTIVIKSTTLGRSIEGTVHGETRQTQSRKIVIRMLSAVVFTFFLSWFPFHAQRLLYVYDRSSSLADVNEWLYVFSGFLYYISTAINPILYNVMSAKYRSAFVQTLCCKPTINHFNRDEQSSMKETTLYRCGSCKSSQIARGRSKSVRYHLENSKEITIKYPDDESYNFQCERRCSNFESTSNHNQNTNESRKLSMIIRSNNRSNSRKNETTKLPGETHI